MSRLKEIPKSNVDMKLNSNNDINIFERRNLGS